MTTFDIPINLKVSAETEEQAEAIVTHLMKQNMEKPALLRQVIEWDFIIFAFEEDYRAQDSPSV